MERHTLHCCSICKTPIEIVGGWSHVEKTFTGKSGISVKISSSVGGWGNHTQWIDFSDEVCNECYTTLGKMLMPVLEFIQNHKGRDSDTVSSMRGNKSSSQGRGESFLRLLPSFHRQKS